jgi:flagellar motor switch protein FliN/FliY
MTNPNAQGQEPAGNFVQLWADSVATVLGQIASQPFAMQLVEAPTEGTMPGEPESSDKEKDLYITVTASGTVRGEMSLRIPQASAAALAKIFVGESGGGAELTADDRAAVEELLRQVAGHVSTAAKPIWKELPLNLALAPAPTWPSAASGWIRSVTGAPADIGIEWRLSAALNAALATAQQQQKAPAENVSASDPARLDFFMDLELDVTLRFGGRNILLKDILQLGPGSVLELDREIQDPADLLLDGKLIARGEVVMVDGNYGLRVTEIFARSQAAA